MEQNTAYDSKMPKKSAKNSKLLIIGTALVGIAILIGIMLSTKDNAKSNAINQFKVFNATELFTTEEARQLVGADVSLNSYFSNGNRSNDDFTESSGVNYVAKEPKLETINTISINVSKSLTEEIAKRDYDSTIQTAGDDAVPVEFVGERAFQSKDSNYLVVHKGKYRATISVYRGQELDLESAKSVATNILDELTTVKQ